MKLQRLLSLVRQAVDQYEMIEEGDHIAIGISGIRCSFESVHRYTGSIPFFLSC